jgi:uncharacterized BrkB/YihY/UPF0761 family membrane protein
MSSRYRSLVWTAGVATAIAFLYLYGQWLTLLALANTFLNAPDDPINQWWVAFLALLPALVVVAPLTCFLVVRRRRRRRMSRG